MIHNSFMRWILVLIVVLSGQMVWAQEKLPLKLISTNTPMQPSAQRQVDTYVHYWSEKLTNSADSDVMKARLKLIEPFSRPSATKIFKAAYTLTLAKDMTSALKSERMFVRLNAMLCVAHLVGPKALNLIKTGLTDKNPAIRYLAGKAAGKVGPKLTDKEQILLLNLLNMSFTRETDQMVVEQLLGGISSLTIPQARRDMLDGLNKRVNVHHANTNITLKADMEALLKLFRQLVREQASDQPVPKQLAKRFARVACRFLIHGAMVLEKQRVHSSMLTQYTNMLEDCDRILRWIASRPMGISENDLPQKDIAPNLQAKRWTEVLLRAEDWRKVLQDPPFNISRRRLRVP